VNTGRKIPICEFNCSVNTRKNLELHILKKRKEKREGGEEKSLRYRSIFLLEPVKYFDKYEKSYSYNNV